MNIQLPTPKTHSALKAAVSAILNLHPERDEPIAAINAIAEQINRLPDTAAEIRDAEAKLAEVRQRQEDALAASISGEKRIVEFDPLELERAQQQLERAREKDRAADRVRRQHMEKQQELQPALDQANAKIRAAEEAALAVIHAEAVAAQRTRHDEIGLLEGLAERTFRAMQERDAKAAGEHLKAVEAENSAWRNTRMAAIQAAIEEHWQQIIASIPE